MKVLNTIQEYSRWLNSIVEARSNNKLIFITLFYLCFSLLLPGCAQKPDIITQTVQGTYSGVAGNGQPITLTVDQIKHGVLAQGTLNSEPFVISGVEIWTATGTISHSDGSSKLVKLYLEPGSENLVIENLGDSQSVLSSGGTPVVLPSGPFSGKYRVEGKGANFASAKITQVGSLIVGSAKISDQFTSITGNVVESNKAIGTITYMDESQVRFEAELSADEQNITLFGMGEPILLEKF